MGIKTSLPGADTARKMTMVVCTFSVAMGIGFFMQQDDAAAGRTPIADAALMKTPTVATMQLGSIAETAKAESIVMPDAVPTAVPEQLTDTAVQVSAEMTDLLEPAFDAVVASATEVMPASVITDVVEEETREIAAIEALDCDPMMTASVRDAALVELELVAACTADAAFTIHHEGMMFSGRTDAQGAATLIVPAMNEEAVFIVAFDDGAGAVAQSNVPTLADYDRVVLQWRGLGGFEIHALEYGATYGEQGHVWHQVPGTASLATAGEGGFIVSLGDARVESPLFAQVYTFPTGKAARPGSVALSVETEITAANCASEVDAQTLERSGSSPVKIADLTLAVPECETIGDFLVLKNLLSDLTLAQG